MHTIEPHYTWRDYYIAEEDKRSPFYGRVYNEFEFTHSIYDHCIHPQWDDIGSQTLFLKILYANYEYGYAIIELIGEWNDLLYNDIMNLKRNIIEAMQEEGINKFILLGEHVLNFHADGTDYYEEWSDDNEEGWIIGINFRDHVLQEFTSANIDYYIAFGGRFDDFAWRWYKPLQLCQKIDDLFFKRLTAHDYEEESDH
ncbi:MAG: hypothetical protein U5Q03_03075 [Bacteroidota bacterium]|nr:hypothetical protein [Bacteroidota bacterium]